MTNFTKNRNQATIKLSLCSELLLRNFEESYGTKFVSNAYFFVSVNVTCAIASFLGNILVIIALRKESSLHPSSKLLFRCLSFTDLCVGLIAQPMFVTYLITSINKNWDGCIITGSVAFIVAAVLCGESISTLTAISVDRLLALLLELRYRQVVTLRRVRLFVISSWITNFAVVFIYFWNKLFFFIVCCVSILLCLSISTFCYIKIYLTSSWITNFAVFSFIFGTSFSSL